MRSLTWTLFGAAMAVLGFLASPAVSQDMLEPNPGIEDTIRGQMDAFLERDVAQAFTFASPNIQGMFGSAENFGRMVENGYPMVWRARWWPRVRLRCAPPPSSFWPSQSAPWSIKNAAISSCFSMRRSRPRMAGASMACRFCRFLAAGPKPATVRLSPVMRYVSVTVLPLWLTAL